MLIVQSGEEISVGLLEIGLDAFAIRNMMTEHAPSHR